MGITRVRLTGPTRKVLEAVSVLAVADGPVNVKFAVIPRLDSWKKLWLIVVLLVGKKAEKVLPAALKLTVMGPVASSVIVAVAGLVAAAE